MQLTPGIETARHAGHTLILCYLDMFGFFASSALGMTIAIADDPAFARELARVAANKPSNSDIYTVPMARFVDTFARVLGDRRLPHLFFVDGGALAVENALKVAFDWKARFNEATGTGASEATGGVAVPRGGARCFIRRGFSRSHRLHPVVDGHGSGQDRTVPDVRLASVDSP